ncbi:MAG: hypothetical protein ABEJ27_01705 [Halodesulfurarchaeum sp.]
MAADPGGDTSFDSQPPAHVRREFWLLVALFNVALLGTGLGVLFLVFETGGPFGWAVLGVGLAAGGYGYGRYRRGEQRREQQD